MKSQTPRFVLAGTNSGCGKTTICCAILQAFVNRGLQTAAFKCGPDYIDTMFHSRIIGTKCSNLDTFFFDNNTLNALLAQNSATHEISVIEGVMGFYDGSSMQTADASTYDVARQTQSPVVLVVNARGAAMSVLAVIQGFLDFLPENQIAAVILNQCTAMTYSMLKKAILDRFCGKIRPLGFLPRLAGCALESRHLGLITAAEVRNLHEKLQILAENAEKYIDLDGLLDLAQAAPQLIYEPLNLPKLPPIRIAVAQDLAFCFYYADSLDVLRQMGAEIVPFSPLEDEKLPENIQGIYLGGGYPELYAERLSQNEPMKVAIRAALAKKIPCIAECGGFMYLTEAIGDFFMVGAIPTKSHDAGKLVRFGYVKLTAQHDNLLCKAGETIAAHEFHHWDCEQNGSSFTAEKLSGKSWSCVFATDTLYAGYPHFHFCANPNFAKNFYTACLEVNYD